MPSCPRYAKAAVKKAGCIGERMRQKSDTAWWERAHSGSVAALLAA